jgi:hypothetical protein
MQPKKQPSPRERGSGPVTLRAHPELRRPVGMQTMGPALYEQLRRALHALRETAER